MLCEVSCSVFRCAILIYKSDDALSQIIKEKISHKKLEIYEFIFSKFNCCFVHLMPSMDYISTHSDQIC